MIISKRIILFIAIALLSFKSFATAQLPNFIFYKGENYFLFTNVFGSKYLNDFFVKSDKYQREFVSDLWRGHIATFELQDKKLMVKDIIIPNSKQEVNPKTQQIDQYISIFSELYGTSEPVAVNYTGTLVLVNGNIVKNVNMGFASEYDSYIIIEVKKGKVKKIYDCNLEQYKVVRDKMFKKFKKTQAYKDQLQELKAKGHTDENIDGFLRLMFQSL